MVQEFGAFKEKCDRYEYEINNLKQIIGQKDGEIQ